MKKFLAAIAASLAVFGASTTFAAVSFNDVPTDHWASNAVYSLAADGIVSPDEQGNFNGNKNATRYQVAVLLDNFVRSHHYSVDVTNSNPFADVPEKHWARSAVINMASAGIIEGFPDVTYRGNRNITRYELAKMLDNLLRTASKISDESAPNPYSDISETSPAYDAVCRMAREKLMEGYGDNTFRGNKNITRYELALILDKINSRYYS